MRGGTFGYANTDPNAHSNTDNHTYPDPYRNTDSVPSANRRDPRDSPKWRSGYQENVGADNVRHGRSDYLLHPKWIDPNNELHPIYRLLYHFGSDDG